MKTVSKEWLKKFEREVRKEFPESYGLQQVHLARFIIEKKTENLNSKELVEYYRKHARVAKRKNKK